MLNIFFHYTWDILLNGNIRSSEKIIEIRAIYLDIHRSRSAVHNVASAWILCPMSWVRIPSPSEKFLGDYNNRLNTLTCWFNRWLSFACHFDNLEKITCSSKFCWLNCSVASTAYLKLPVKIWHEIMLSVGWAARRFC